MQRDIVDASTCLYMTSFADKASVSGLLVRPAKLCATLHGLDSYYCDGYDREQRGCGSNGPNADRSAFVPRDGGLLTSEYPYP